MRKLQLLLITAVLTLGVAVAAQAGVPQLINYQGIILDGNGDPVTTQVSIIFTIYDDPGAGATQWTETRDVTPDADGRFTVLLGQVNPVGDAVFAGANRWLGVKAGGDPEMTPRAQIVSVAYAHRVGTIDGASGGTISGSVEAIGFTIGGAPIGQSSDTYWSANGPDIFYNSGNVGIGTTTPGAKLNIIKDGDVAGIEGGGLHALELASGTSGDYFGLFMAPTSTEGISYIQSVQHNIGKTPLALNPQGGKIGIGTTSPLYKLDVVSSGDFNQSIYSRATDDGVARFGLMNTTRHWTISNWPTGEFAIADETAVLVRMAIDEDGNVMIPGNVGIGTDPPTEKLDVAGNGIFTGNVSFGGVGSRLTGNQGGSIEIGPTNGVSGETPYIDFHFGGGVAQDYSAQIVTTADDQLEIHTSSSAAVLVVKGDQVGIGTVPAEKLDVDGNIHASGTITSGNSIAIDGVTGTITVTGPGNDLDLITDEIRISGKAMIGPGHAATGVNAFVAGQANTANGPFSTVSGGMNNTATELAGVGGSTVGGGIGNFATALATVGGGDGNNASGVESAIGGGQDNTASGEGAAIAGGLGNTASGAGAFVGAGQNNEAQGPFSVVVGGDRAFIGGPNQALGNLSVVVGGGSNKADGDTSFVGGGSNNVASGPVSTVPGGGFNTAAGRWSFATGFHAIANHTGTFVWADASTSVGFVSTGVNQFLVRAQGGVGINTNNPAAMLHVAGSIQGDDAFYFDENADQGVSPRFQSAVIGFNYSGTNYDRRLRITAGEEETFDNTQGACIDLHGNQCDLVTWGKHGDLDLVAGTGVPAATPIAVGQITLWTGKPNTPRMIITAGGDVGIGRTPTANDLEVEGTASKSTAGSWLANSDSRIKTDVQSLENALAMIDHLRPVEFKYTDEYRVKHPSIENRTYVNFIAQEYQQVFPNDVKDSGEDNILQVDTYAASIYSVAAIQELHQQNREQQFENVDLKKRVEHLEALVKQLLESR